MRIKTKYIIALLGCVFASPSFISAAGSQVKLHEQVNVDSIFNEPAYVIHLNVYEQNQMVYCNFRTEFKCKSYAIEGKLSESDEFRSLVYCNDELCVDSREWVDISFMNTEYNCRYFRIKTELPNGEVRYSQVQSMRARQVNEVEIVNTVVSSHLYFRYNEAKQAMGYHYTIAGLNGEAIKSDEPATDSYISLETLPAGFYIISFRSLDGITYHYKFFKTANL